MANKAELLEQAKSQGLDVNTKTTKADLESMLGTSDSSEAKSSGNTADEPSVETVVVNSNDDGEATSGTTKEGDTSEVTNKDSIPQNDAENTPEDGDAEGRSTEEFEFADESNPNNKARWTGAGGSEYDQDGNLRTGGKSYGVADDRNEGVTEASFEQNAGEAPEGADRVSETYFNPQPGSDDDTNHREWTPEDQHKLEQSLSEPDNSITARVTTSVGNYVRVKFYRNGLPLGTFRSRDFSEAKARKYLNDVKEERGL